MKMSSVMFLGLKRWAADSGVGASQVAWFPGKGEGAEGSRNVFGELRARGGIDCVGGSEIHSTPLTTTSMRAHRQFVFHREQCA
jgi:hypothetical protein